MKTIEIKHDDEQLTEIIARMANLAIDQEVRNKRMIEQLDQIYEKHCGTKQQEVNNNGT